MRRALFLDRDGVINVDHGYVHHKSNFQFIDGIFDLMTEATRRGYYLFVVTNQSGIARGLYTERDFHELTDWMCNQFSYRGVHIKKVYFSPYHPSEGIGEYRKDDCSRKPKPGMIIQAKADFGIDLSKSILIGDKDTDIQAGLAAGVGRNIHYVPDLGLLNQRRQEYSYISSVREAICYL